jgi:hypothetical protein
MFERFTQRARSVVVHMQEEARVSRSPRIGVRHVPAALLLEADGVGGRVLADLGVTLERARAAAGAAGDIGADDGLDADALASLGIDLGAVRSRVEEVFGSGALSGPVGRRRRGHIPFDREAKEMLQSALRESRRLRHGYIGTEHILLGAAMTATGRDVLVRLGVDPADLEPLVLQTLRRAG